MNPPVITSFAHAAPDQKPLSVNQLIDLLNTVVSSNIQGSYIPYIIGSDTPGVEDTDKAWIKTDSGGRPIEIRLYYNGVWRRIYNGMLGEVRGYTGDPTNDFDGNGLGIVGGNYDGWHICNGQDGTPDLSDMFLIGAHMNNRDIQGYQSGLGGWVTGVQGASAPEATGGAREITLDANNTYSPAAPAITTALWSADGNAPTSGGDLWGQGAANPKTIVGANAGNPTPPAINIINPFVAIAWIIFVGYA